MIVTTFFFYTQISTLKCTLLNAFLEHSMSNNAQKTFSLYLIRDILTNVFLNLTQGNQALELQNSSSFFPAYLGYKLLVSPARMWTRDHDQK